MLKRDGVDGMKGKIQINVRFLIHHLPARCCSCLLKTENC